MVADLRCRRCCSISFYYPHAQRFSLETGSKTMKAPATDLLFVQFFEGKKKFLRLQLSGNFARDFLFLSQTLPFFWSRCNNDFDVLLFWKES